jgi:hypothetical protein
MPFAVGFILFFYLDIFVSLHFTALGMMPMAFLIAAVSLFVSIVLIRANPTVFSRPERRLNRIWILSLIVIAIVQFVSNMWGDSLSEILRMKTIMLSRVIDWTLFGVSVILLLFTFFWRQKTVYYRWQVFCSFSIFIQDLLPVTIWRLMPVKVYAFYGLMQMPMLFGLLMMIDSVLKRRFGFEDFARSRHA